jgi:hypothetical protein
MIFIFQELQHGTNITNAAAIIGLTLYALSFLALSQLQETHGTDLDYVETLREK